MSSQKICVIYNPRAGRGQADRVVRSARKRCGPQFEFHPTNEPAQAEKFARVAAQSGYRQVIAAGGDGTVHEVANGLLQAGETDTTLGIWPIGSANDYAFTLGLCDWWHGENRERPRSIIAVDVGQVSAPDGRSRYFVNGMGVGFNGAVTLESRRITKLRGLPLYAWATLQAMRRHFRYYQMSIRFDDEIRTGPTFALSINLGQREGNFPLTPNASLTDGLFDCIHTGELTRWGLLRLMPSMATGRLPADHPNLWQCRCRRVELHSEEPIRVHLDGEFFCHPEDGISELTVELLPRRLRVDSFEWGAVSDVT